MATTSWLHSAKVVHGHPQPRRLDPPSSETTWLPTIEQVHLLPTSSNSHPSTTVGHLLVPMDTTAHLQEEVSTAMVVVEGL